MNKILKYMVTSSLILIFSILISSIIYESITILNLINSLFVISLLILIISLASIVLHSGFFHLFIISFRKMFVQGKNNESEFRTKYNQKVSSLTKHICTSAGTLVIVTLAISLWL